MPGSGKQSPEVQAQIKELLEAGFDPTTIHRRLKVGRSSVYRMKRCLEQHGTNYMPPELNKKNGRPKVLTADQELEVLAWLRTPSNRNRYLDDLVWLIHNRFGIVCSTTTMSKMKRKWLHVIEYEETGRPLDDVTRQQLLETHPDLPVLQGLPSPPSDHLNAHDVLSHHQQQDSSDKHQQLLHQPSTDSEFPNVLKYEHDPQLEEEHHEQLTDPHLHPDLASASHFPDSEPHDLHDSPPEPPAGGREISEPNVDFGASPPDPHQRPEVDFDAAHIELADRSDDTGQSLQDDFSAAPAIDSRLEQQLHDQITAAAVAAVAVAEAAEAAAALGGSKNL